MHITELASRVHGRVLSEFAACIEFVLIVQIGCMHRELVESASALSVQSAFGVSRTHGMSMDCAGRVRASGVGGVCRCSACTDGSMGERVQGT